MGPGVRTAEGTERFSGPKAMRTRELLLDTTKRLFFERGYEATAVEHIAEAAGVSRATFYTYFPSKKDVVIALSQRNSDALVAVMARLRELPERWTTAHLTAWVCEYFAYLDEHGAWAQAWDEASRTDPELHGARRTTVRSYTRSLGKQFQRLSGPTGADPMLDGMMATAMLQRVWRAGHEGDLDGVGDVPAAAAAALAALLRRGPRS